MIRRQARKLLRAMGQGITTTQFYLHGRTHFTRNGWLEHSASYPSPDPLEAVDITGRSYVVTGATRGIGKEITSFLARKGGKVYMLCRNQEDAELARKDIMESGNVAQDKLVIVACDVALERDVRRVASDISGLEPQGIDGLVCNAGTLLNERTLTEEGLEVTFAGHFLIGAYLLSKLLRPSLHSAALAGREPRVVMVSSGGMLNTAFPAWNVAASLPEDDGTIPAYDGQLAYAYAKRGQVLLCERLADFEAKNEESGKQITYVSAHPGWTATKGVADAYGEYQSWLEPMRSLWEGAEGICWLCVAKASQLEPGAFYLDRQPQVKHMSGGYFFTEGWFTKNTDEEVDAMLEKAEQKLDKSTVSLVSDACVKLDAEYKGA
mmetsp:Transcript_52529/g.96136  ORF Transcript_52529/g.96136 Transcript_52529/m.96136 type:complete len:379 (+) Transcript_52529:46-1182(+)